MVKSKFSNVQSLSMFITHQNVSTLPCFLYHEWKEGLGIFLRKKRIFHRSPFSKLIFQNRLAHLHTNFELDRTDRFQENGLFSLKIDNFEKKFIWSIISTLEVASVQRTVPIDSAHSLQQKGVIFIVLSSLFLEK